MIKNKSFFLVLLPVFFVFHGYTENFNSVNEFEALKLTGIYILFCIAVYFVFRLVMKDKLKAQLMAFFLMSGHFFFGAFVDTLKHLFEGMFIGRYIFILPVCLLLLIFIFIRLKKTQKDLSRFRAFLNIVLLVIIAMDVFWHGAKVISNSKNHEPDSKSVSSKTNKPDIYLIILDEYAGEVQLKEQCNFDNSDFENILLGKGFRIIRNNRGNYRSTPFSIASLMQMKLLDLGKVPSKRGNLSFCYKKIRESRVLAHLKQKGYDFYNYSIFDFDGQNALIHEAFLPNSTSLITYQTFTNRLFTDILIDARSGKLSFIQPPKKWFYTEHVNNQRIYNLTAECSKKIKAKPKFVYTHFMMPHFPYYVNSKGEPFPFDHLKSLKNTNTAEYLEYLQYTNTKITQLVDSILRGSPKPPVVILMGDHGYRHHEDQKNQSIMFNSLHAVLVPDRNYSLFYDGMTNMNHFPVLFNTLFKDGFTLEKDSVVYLKTEKH